MTMDIHLPKNSPRLQCRYLPRFRTGPPSHIFMMDTKIRDVLQYQQAHAQGQFGTLGKVS